MVYDMNLFELSLADLTHDHLNALIDNKVSESSTLEFKRETYGNADADKKELLKDVSALANTNGGLLFVGIDEVEGCADSIVPFTENIDTEIQRINAIIESSIEPRVADIEIRGIKTEPDGNIIAVQVPKSWSAPHRTNFKGVKRFYRRNSAGVYEPDVTELKKMFNASIEQEAQFKALRQKHINRVRQEETPVVMPTESNGFMLLQLIPLQALENIKTLDITSHDLRANLRPLNGSGWNHRYNIDGFVTFRAKNHSYTQLYRNGTIEATVSSISREFPQDSGKQIIAGTSLIINMLSGITRYLHLQNELGLHAPIRVYVSLLDVKGCRFATYNNRWGFDDDEIPTIGRNDALLPPIDIMEFGNKFEIYEAMRPVLDALWNADDRDRCNYFDENGKWIGNDNVRELGQPNK